MENKNKYSVGDYVVIDRIFGTEVDPAGSMEKLERKRICEVVEVSNTSSGPAYKLVVIGEPKIKPRAYFWEEDILDRFDI